MATFSCDMSTDVPDISTTTFHPVVDWGHAQIAVSAGASTPTLGTCNTPNQLYVPSPMQQCSFIDDSRLQTQLPATTSFQCGHQQNTSSSFPTAQPAHRLPYQMMFSPTTSLMNTFPSLSIHSTDHEDAESSLCNLLLDLESELPPPSNFQSLTQGHAEDNYEIVMSDLGLDEELAAGHLPFAATSGPSLGSPYFTAASGMNAPYHTPPGSCFKDQHTPTNSSFEQLIMASTNDSARSHKIQDGTLRCGLSNRVDGGVTQAEISPAHSMSSCWQEIRLSRCSDGEERSVHSCSPVMDSRARGSPCHQLQPPQLPLPMSRSPLTSPTRNHQPLLTLSPLHSPATRQCSSPLLPPTPLPSPNSSIYSNQLASSHPPLPSPSRNVLSVHHSLPPSPLPSPETKWSSIHPPSPLASTGEATNEKKVQPSLPPSPLPSPSMSEHSTSKDTMTSEAEEPSFDETPPSSPEPCVAWSSAPQEANPTHPSPPSTKPRKRRRRRTSQLKSAALDRKNEKADIPQGLQLYEYLLHLLEMGKAVDCIEWEDASRGFFRITNTERLACEWWGVYRSKPAMNYDKMSRAMRFYYKRNILARIPHKLLYKFTEGVMKQVELLQPSQDSDGPGNDGARS